MAKSYLYTKEENDEEYSHLKKQMPRYVWKNALRKSGYAKRDSTNRTTIRPHVLRKFFRTRLVTVLRVDIVVTFIGHVDYLTEVCRWYSFGDLGRFYQQGELTLTVFGSMEDVNKLREEISRKIK